LDDGASYGVAMEAADHGQDVQGRFCHAAKVPKEFNESTRGNAETAPLSVRPRALTPKRRPPKAFGVAAALHIFRNGCSRFNVVHHCQDAVAQLSVVICSFKASADQLQSHGCCLWK
jgi:hypothetical protein